MNGTGDVSVEAGEFLDMTRPAIWIQFRWVIGTLMIRHIFLGRPKSPRPKQESSSLLLLDQDYGAQT